MPRCPWVIRRSKDRVDIGILQEFFKRLVERFLQCSTLYSMQHTSQASRHVRRVLRECLRWLCCRLNLVVGILIGYWTYIGGNHHPRNALRIPQSRIWICNVTDGGLKSEWDLACNTLMNKGKASTCPSSSTCQWVKRQKDVY